MCDFCAREVGGDYRTPARGNPFHVEVVHGDVHVYSGFRFKQRGWEKQEEGNVVLWEKDRLIHETVEWLASREGARLGAVPDNHAPEPDSLEAFIRPFSIAGNLASYFPPILERLGAAQVYREGRAWCIRSAPRG
ncbi:MAG: hypothetical protein HY722_04205 [Planctomycetes bacterium]|nr:hypothetical protein [Planctomycetota bacterium]